MLPVTSCFSRPPMRCSSPGVPGTAQGRASVSGSRLYGRYAFGEFFSVANFTLNSGISSTFGNLPRLRAVGEVSVGQNNHRHHVFHGDAAGFDGGPEAIARRRRSNHGNRRFGVASEQRLQQIGLLGLSRQAGGRAAALNVANHQRHLDHDREPDALPFSAPCPDPK